MVDRVYAVLTEVAGRVPLLLVEQDTERALRLAARAYVMAAGRVALSGPAGEVAGRDELVASYLGRTATVSDGA